MIAVASTATAVAAGLLMTLADRENYPSIGAGLWWAAQTVTTVGYGDNVPVTVLGRLIAVLVMLVGISFLTVITAAITRRVRHALTLRADALGRRDSHGG